MALDPGGAGGAGTTSSGGGGYIPWQPAPPPIVNTLLGAVNNPVYSVPDYASLINQYSAPYEAMLNQQLAMLKEQLDKQAGFARDEFGINKDAAGEAHDTALREIINMLAARGILDSGDRKYRTGVENRRYRRQMGLLQNALQRYLYGLQASYQSAQMSGQMGLQQQRMALGPQLAQQYPPTAYNSAFDQFLTNRQPYVPPTG